MEYSEKLRVLGCAPNAEHIGHLVELSRRHAKENFNKDVLMKCYSCLDLTSLDVTDTVAKIASFTEKVVGQSARFPGVPDAASICVYPPFVETVGVGIGDSNIRITSVAGGFPSSQTFLEVKMLEAAMAVENGADEIDAVINVGDILAGEYDAARSELKILRVEIGEDITFKVIIESGALETPEAIYNASLVAMLAGADFVKTSTGKLAVSATPEHAVVMCQAIRAHHEHTGSKIGFKAAGGIRTPEDAVLYYSIVETILGEEWLNPRLFRIGASSVANSLLSAITGTEVNYY